MNRRCFLAQLTSLFSCASLFSAKNTYAGNRPFIMGVFPRRNIKTTYQLFTPMAEFLSETLNQEVRLETTKNFSAFWKAVKEKRYDLVHYNQYHYIVSHLHYGYDVILKNQELGKSTISGSLIVRKDSGFEKVSDLRGKAVLFGGDKRAMQSYISATWLLKQGGLHKGDYEEKFAINPLNTIISTFFKRADASGSGDVVMHLDNVKKRIDISQLKFLAKTKPLPHLPWAVKAEIADEKKLIIKHALIGLTETTEGRRILRDAKLDALVPATDVEYDVHREIITDVYGSNYGIDNLK